MPAAGLFQPSFSQAFGQMFPGMLGAPGFQLPPNGKGVCFCMIVWRERVNGKSRNFSWLFLIGAESMTNI